MITLLATPGARRLPALLLAACLLVGTAAATPHVPVHDDASDGMRSYGSTHAQVVRAPQLRTTPPAGHAPVGVPATALVPPSSWLVGVDAVSGPPVAPLRQMPRLSPLSRAPPALS